MFKIARSPLQSSWQASLRMFMDLDLINKFNIDYLTLCRSGKNFPTKTLSYTKYFRWLCTVKKNYREVICQFMTNDVYQLTRICRQVIITTIKNLCEGELPQLAARVQRLPADVRHPDLNHLVEPLRRGRGTWAIIFLVINITVLIIIVKRNSDFSNSDVFLEPRCWRW